MTPRRAITILVLLLAAAVSCATPSWARKRVMGLAIGGSSHHAYRHAGRPHGGFTGAMSAGGIARNLGY